MALVVTWQSGATHVPFMIRAHDYEDHTYLKLHIKDCQSSDQLALWLPPVVGLIQVAPGKPP